MRRQIYAGNNLQHRALARSITSDHPQHLAPRNLERNILDRVEIVIVRLVPEQLGKQLTQSVGAFLNDSEALRDVFQPNWDCTGGHCWLRRRKRNRPDTFERWQIR